MSIRSFALLAAAALLVPSARAQRAVLPSPFEPSTAPSDVDGLVLRPVAQRIVALQAETSLVLHGVALPGGALVDLELERIDLAKRRFGFRVDGEPRPDLLDGLALTVWKGRVAGVEGSEAMLSFSLSGSRGWIAVGNELVHVLPRPDARGDWRRGDVILASEESLNRRGVTLDFECEAARPNTLGGETLRVPRTSPADPSSQGGSLALGQCSLRECKVAIEGDWQLFQQFNDLAAETAYITTLLSFVSDRYETQASTVLTFPHFNLWSTSNDGWSAQDSGANDCIDVLEELQATWVGNVPGGADLGHLLSGANLGCGVAWLDVLCDEEFNFSVSGNMNGNLPFPVTPGPSNWDFIVVAHEIGHNFDALHTHDYCPPLDSCAPSGYFGQCQTSQVCTNQGSIMSYCHLCSGGTSNITTLFHATSAADMTAAAQSCLPAFVAIDGTTPILVAPNVATPVTAAVTGTPTGGVTLFHRAGPGAFTPIAMTNQGGGQWSAMLPAAACGTTPQFYYSFTDAGCGPATDPAGAPASFHSTLVGTSSTTLADNFQTDLGWTPTNLGATSGQWQRGVPVNDSGWAYDPASDQDGSGQCWLTGNTAGNTDIDGGAVQLLSPAFSLAGGQPLVTYAYYLRLTDDDGADRLLVEASSNGTGGPWAEVARHDTDGGSWRTHAIDAGDFAAAGVVLSANMRLRFTANDGGAASIVEAGLDAFVASVLSCNQIGTNYCSPTTNSTGQPATMSATGSASVGANNLDLHASPVPTTTSGVVFFGSGQTNVPLGNGFRCVGGSLFRLPPTQTTTGALHFDVNNAVAPAAGNLTAGSTWNFQTWYRDVPAGGALFNLSDGYTVTFVP